MENYKIHSGTNGLMFTHVVVTVAVVHGGHHCPGCFLDIGIQKGTLYRCVRAWLTCTHLPVCGDGHTSPCGSFVRMSLEHNATHSMSEFAVMTIHFATYRYCIIHFDTIFSYMPYCWCQDCLLSTLKLCSFSQHTTNDLYGHLLKLLLNWLQVHYISQTLYRRCSS